MKKILVNYNFTPEKDWLGTDYIIYDRSDSDKWLKDFPQEKIVKTPNIGQVDYDKLGYIVENYTNLPEAFLWGKTNLFKYIFKEEYAILQDNKTFTPLLTQHHKTYGDEQGEICYYSNGIYYERNNSWYLNVHESRNFRNWDEWADVFSLPKPEFIPFAPGGNYILTRERVYRYPKEYYELMRSTMPYDKEPGEAHLAERSYYLMWK